MTSPHTIARVERMAWVLIYGGLFIVIIGIITRNIHLITGWSLGVLGGIAVAAGMLLIWMRSRMTASPAPGAQSTPDSQGKP